VGYLYGITSERRFDGRGAYALAYRWFSRLGFEREIPDHSTFSKNRHGRFRGTGVFLEVFEEIVRRCLKAGLVEGKRLTVDGTMVDSECESTTRTKPERLGEVARVSRTVRDYLADLLGFARVGDEPCQLRQVVAHRARDPSHLAQSLGLRPALWTRIRYHHGSIHGQALAFHQPTFKQRRTISFKNFQEDPCTAESAMPVLGKVEWSGISRSNPSRLNQRYAKCIRTSPSSVFHW